MEDTEVSSLDFAEQHILEFAWAESGFVAHSLSCVVGFVMGKFCL